MPADLRSGGPGLLRGVVAVLAIALAVASADCDGVGPVPLDPEVLWRVPATIKTDHMILTDTSVVAGIRDPGTLVSFDRRTGERLWERVLGSPTIFFERELSRFGELVFAAPVDLFALDVATGEIRWTMRSANGHLTRTPVLDGNAMYVGNAYGEVMRLVPTTGDTVWRVDIREAVFGMTVADQMVVFGTRAFADTAARDGLGTGRVIALSADDGRLLWATAIGDPPGYPGSGGVVSPPLVVDGTVVVGTQSSRVVGLSLADGTKRWEYGSGSPVSSQYGSSGNVGLLDGLAVLFRNVGLLEAFDPASGTLAWVAGAPRESASGLARPTVHDGRVYAVFEGNIWIVDSDGTVLWRYGKRADLDGLPVFHSGPTVADDGTIFVGALYETEGFPTYLMAIRPPDLP